MYIAYIEYCFHTIRRAIQSQEGQGKGYYQAGKAYGFILYGIVLQKRQKKYIIYISDRS